MSAIARAPSAGASPWLVAARPRTLALSVSPVVVGSALAWAMHGRVNASAVLAALIGSVCIQVGTNLHNDAADSERGGDGPDRVGPKRVTASGLLSADAVKRAAMTSFAIAASMGTFLVAVGGWPILVLGILSILCGWAYTGGPRPIAYTPLGELFVIAFFGVGAVGGTYWLCTGRFDAVAASAGVALGCMAGGVLLVNNHRDRVGDARVGRRTLAIVAGPAMSALLYAAMMLAPYALLFPIADALPRHPVWMPLFVLPAALLLICDFMRSEGAELNAVLARTVHAQLLFTLLLAAALLI